jgi:hypothetical protein
MTALDRAKNIAQKHSKTLATALLRENSHLPPPEIVIT